MTHGQKVDRVAQAIWGSLENKQFVDWASLDEKAKESWREGARRAMTATREQTIEDAALPHYQSHKVVRAARIHAAGCPADDGENIYVVVRLSEESEQRGEYTFPKHTAVLLVPKDVYARKTENADYIVVYEDGYVSWSPAKAFEEGYRRV